MDGVFPSRVYDYRIDDRGDDRGDPPRPAVPSYHAAIIKAKEARYVRICFLRDVIDQHPPTREVSEGIQALVTAGYLRRCRPTP